jgi:vacuolar protein sorting-associated protein 16
MSRFWYLKLHALTAMRDFEGLETFSRSKRSPIGYEAFVRHLVEKGHAKEAVSYVQRCDANKRVDLYVECREWSMAGKECKERGDRARLECVIVCLLLSPFRTMLTEAGAGSCVLHVPTH